MSEALKQEPEIVIRTMDYSRPVDARALAALVHQNREYLERFEGITSEMYTDPTNVAQMFAAPGAPSHWGIQIGQTLAGFVSILRYADRRSASLGYSVAKEYAERGVATAAVRAVIAALPKVITTIFARVDPENIASVRVLEKLGFENYGSASSPSGSKEVLFRLDRLQKK